MGEGLWTSTLVKREWPSKALLILSPVGWPWFEICEVHMIQHLCREGKKTTLFLVSLKCRSSSCQGCINGLSVKSVKRQQMQHKQAHEYTEGGFAGKSFPPVPSASMQVLSDDVLHKHFSYKQFCKLPLTINNIFFFSLRKIHIWEHSFILFVQSSWSGAQTLLPNRGWNFSKLDYFMTFEWILTDLQVSTGSNLLTAFFSCVFSVHVTKCMYWSNYM